MGNKKNILINQNLRSLHLKKLFFKLTTDTFL